jgi:hypothetical protein
MTELDIATMVREHLGMTPGRIRLPGPPVAYDEVRVAEQVSPLLAMKWIAATWAKYENGRNFYPTKLEKIMRYAELMRSGAWEYRPDGDPIQVTDGIITGGRHRLHAILLSHTTQKMNVLYRTKKDS